MPLCDAPLDPAARRRSLSLAVKAALAEHGMTLSEAIARSEADPATTVGATKWKQIEAGTGALAKPATLGKVAKVLDVDLGALLTAAGYDDIANARNARGGISSQMAAMQAQLHRLTAAVEQLLDERPPPPPDRPNGR